MANSRLFRSQPPVPVAVPVAQPKAATTRNAAGGLAYKLGDKLALAVYVCTGCLNGTFYATAEDQFDQVKKLAANVPNDFIARLAVYGRKHSFMKDMPALLLAMLSGRDPVLFRQVFPIIVDNGRMLRTFVQIVRSGSVCKKNLNGTKRKAIQAWFNGAGVQHIINGMTGNDPSMAEVIALAHVKPNTEEKEALFGWLLGMEAAEGPESTKCGGYLERTGARRNNKPVMRWVPRKYGASKLPQQIKELEAFKAGTSTKVPNVPFLMLAGLDTMSARAWKEIAKNANWHTTRMNLNTFNRHNVFNEPAMIKLVSDRLRNREEVLRSKVFPYQLMAASMFADTPYFTSALQDAMEVAIENIPEVEGGVAVCPDISSSMISPVTGSRGSASTKINCVHVSALVAAAFLRRNPRNSVIVPFNDRYQSIQFDAKAPVMTNANAIINRCTGGTACQAALSELNRRGAQQKLVVFVSDNMSWADIKKAGATGLMAEWVRYKARVPDAKLVCMDVSPSITSPAYDRKDILNIGGFSDVAFEVINRFYEHGLEAGNWVKLIEGIDLTDSLARTKYVE